MKNISFKISAILFVILGIFTFLSCEKENEYNPKRKITNTYYQSVSIDNGVTNDSGKKLLHSFEWEGDLLKKMISRQIGMPFASHYTFEYDDKRLTNIYSLGIVHASVIYDGDIVSKLEFYSTEGKVIASELYEYTDSKLTKLTKHTHIPSDSKELKNIFSMLDIVLHDHSFKNDSEITTVTFEWEGDNISKSILTYPSSYTRVEEYKYDDKHNPFYKSLQYSIGVDATMLSKNNVVEIVKESTLLNTRYEYEYENKFPIKRTLISEMYSDTYYMHYEYEE